MLDSLLIAPTIYCKGNCVAHDNFTAAEILLSSSHETKALEVEQQQDAHRQNQRKLCSHLIAHRSHSTATVLVVTKSHNAIAINQCRLDDGADQTFVLAPSLPPFLISLKKLRHKT
eukprot:6178737-Pleurochrysis_carterae.AAC.1